MPFWLNSILYSFSLCMQKIEVIPFIFSKDNKIRIFQFISMYFGFVPYWWKFLTCIEIHVYACPHYPIKEQCCGYFHNSYLYAYTFIEMYKCTNLNDIMTNYRRKQNLFLVWTCLYEVAKRTYSLLCTSNFVDLL